MSLSRSFRNPGVLSHFNTKLSLVLLLPLALVVTSCDSDDDEESSSDDPVSFECTDDIYCSDFAPCAQKCNNGFCEESFDNSRCLSDNPCEIGVCSPDVADADANGCSFTQKDCADDDNSCTVNHHCDAESGGCVYDLGVGCCDFDADCEDGVACTVDICTDHLCTPQYDHGYCLSRDTNKCDGLGAECTDEGCAGVEAAIDCDDDDPCTSELCIDATGVCEYSVASVSGACCNSDVCNGANECCTPDSNSTLPLGCYPKEYCDGYVCVEELSSEVCLRGADLSAQNIMLSKDSSARGEALLATWEIYNNNADDVTDPVHYQYLLSEDELPDAGDIRLYALEERITSGTIAARGQLSIQQKVYLQEDTGSGLVPLHESVFGDYNILFEVNPSHEAGVVETNYDNNVAASPIHLRHVCENDPYEAGGTNLPSGAVDLDIEIASAGLPYNTGFLSICPADLDYFAWTLPVDETATFIIDGMDTIGTGDLDFFLYEQNGANLGELLGYSTSTDSQSEEIIFTNNTGSDLLVYLEVRAFQPEYSNIYSLSIVSVD